MKIIIYVALVLIILGALGYWLLGPQMDELTLSPSPSESSIVTASPTISPYNQSISDGTLKVAYSSTYFGLATTPAQIPVKSYIPPCSPTFDYCLYYNDNTYVGTNFESAGLRIQKRKDLTTQTQCLNTLPSGYSSMVATTYLGSDYATSVFSPLADAAAGHYSSGAEYRLWSGNLCHEFETRIGQTQFANYAPGAIKEFTAANQATVKVQLEAMLNEITIANGQKVSFPQAK